MAHGDGLKFRIVVAEMDNYFGEAGLQILDGIQVKVFPLLVTNGGVGHHDRIEQNIFFRELGEQFGVAKSSRKKRKMVFVGDLNVGGEQFWTVKEQRAHVTVEMRGMNAQRDGAIDLSAYFDLRFLRFGVSSN